MDGPDPISGLGLGCPFNGTFYICKDSPTRFIGCCTSNPCRDRKGLCPDEHLEPATFEARYRIPSQACINDNFAVSWYTCPKTTPPFLGCCAVDPCDRGGCPDTELRAAKLSDKESDADLFVGGISPGSSDMKWNPSAKVSITTATLTASYISTKTIEAGIEATSTLDSASPASHPPDGKKGLSTGAIVGITIGLVVALFILGVIIAYIYWHHKYGWVHTTGDSQSSSHRSTPSWSTSPSQKGLDGPIYGIFKDGRFIGFEVPPKIAFGQDPGQEIHTRSSSEERQPQPERGERRTQQPQPGQDTRPPIPRKPVPTFNTDQKSMSIPSTPQPPHPPSSDRQNRRDQPTKTQPDDRDYKPWSPNVELPTNTETPLSTCRSSTLVHHTMSDDISSHEPEPRHPEGPRRPPTTRPDTAPLGDISEEQSAKDIDFSSTLATRSERRLDHDQPGFRVEQQEGSRGDNKAGSNQYDGGDYKKASWES